MGLSYSLQSLLIDAFRVPDKVLLALTPLSLATFKRSLKTYFYVQCFINIVFTTFSPRVVDIVKCPWSNFYFYLRHLNIDYT